MFDSFPTLHTNRLDLVEIKQSHLQDIYRLFSDENVTRFYNVVPLKEEKEAQKFVDHFRNRFSDRAGIRWGISLKGESGIIGTIGFNNFTQNHRANIGYDLQTNYWNNRYMTEALQPVLNFGFQKLEINRIEAEVIQGNVMSEKLLTRFGFKNEGILREWMYWNGKHYDMTMFSLLRSDR